MIGRLFFYSYSGSSGGNSNSANYKGNNSKSREGDVSVEDKAYKEKKINKDEGEYIDFEEIK